MKLPLKFHSAVDGCATVRDADNQRVASYLAPDAAELLVTACNAHDQLRADLNDAREQLEAQAEALRQADQVKEGLVDALMTALPFLEDMKDDPCYKVDTVPSALAKVRAALAAAGAV